MGKKVGIVVAVNGGMQRDQQGAKVPVTPAEIAEDALLCFKEGAAVVHVHARDAQGNNSGDVAIYQDVIRRIRASCDILIQTTNGIGVRRDPRTGEFLWPSDEDCSRLIPGLTCMASRQVQSISIIPRADIRSRHLM
jgi:3-keto-5-aminohexanoate cleavage enzyme